MLKTRRTGIVVPDGYTGFSGEIVKDRWVHSPLSLFGYCVSAISQTHQLDP
jgi:hypothetical protein